MLPLYESVESGAIGHNGNIFTVGEEGILKEWIVETGRLVRKKRIAGGTIEHLEYDAVSNRFLAVTAEHNLVVVDFEQLRVTRQIVGFHDEVCGIWMNFEKNRIYFLAFFFKLKNISRNCKFSKIKILENSSNFFEA